MKMNELRRQKLDGQNPWQQAKHESYILIYHRLDRCRFSAKGTLIYMSAVPQRESSRRLKICVQISADTNGDQLTNCAFPVHHGISALYKVNTLRPSF